MFFIRRWYKVNDCGMIKIIFIIALVIFTELNTTITIMKRSRVKPHIQYMKQQNPKCK